MNTGDEGCRPLRVVVCGTTFGQIYLEGLRVPGIPFELAGIVAQGSERSHACAEHYRVPLYRRIEELPQDIDIACVVVRSGLLGGRGVELAQALMRRGIHVLQEHPLHHAELAECLRVARRQRVLYGVNSFYIHLAPVRRFVAAARALFQRQPPLYIDAACGFQLVFALLDILGQALGGLRPWGLAPTAPLPDTVRQATELEPVFRSLDGVIAGVPLSLRVQNQLNPADPDNFAHLMHRITLGTESGNLTLVATHGPVLWLPRPRYPRSPRDPRSSPHFGDVAAETTTPATATILGPIEAPTEFEVFQTLWPNGVAQALLIFRRAILAGEDGLRQGQYYLSLCQLWQGIGVHLGPPEALDGPPPQELPAHDLMAIAAAAQEAGEFT